MRNKIKDNCKGVEGVIFPFTSFKSKRKKKGRKKYPPHILCPTDR